MKKSELYSEIKNYITEVLSEEEGVISTKDETKAEKLAKKGLNVNLAEQDNTLTDKVNYIAQALEHAWFLGSGNNKVDFKDMAESIVYDLDEHFSENLQEKKEEDDDEKEDNWNKPDKDDVGFQEKEPSKKDLAKEKIKTPSKFKIPNPEFEDFKTKLKNLVTKVKNMEKGAERDKKLAALKQFIKKPELIKAFKERDVKIDTGGLVG
jgi:hypothetical protein